jgi:Flp pilus assembly protein TadG
MPSTWRIANSRHNGRSAGFARRQVGEFLTNQSANTAITFALCLPILLAAMGAAVDYSFAAATRSKMQSVADSAAVASARELILARSRPDRISAIATNVVNQQLKDVTPTVKIDFKAMTVQVTITKQYAPYFIGSDMRLLASATAKMSGSLPLCLLGLDPSGPKTIALEKSALITAPRCLVQSNSKSPVGLQAKDNAVIKAGMICTSGGKSQSSNASFSPPATTDCPVQSDPLRSRIPPSVGGCSFNDKVVDGTDILSPGVYCGGLTLTNGADVRLSPGIYIIKDGPLTVEDGASISGTGVGIYLTGSNANLTFDADTTVDLSAPKNGPLAGILIFDDPSGTSAPAKAPKSGRGASGRASKGAPRQHQILSDNARNLLGTIYMPQGEIIIDALKPIADKSAYTVLVVKRLNLYSGPNLVLNTDYSATDVPVPMGLGPYAARIFITN